MMEGRHLPFHPITIISAFIAIFALNYAELAQMVATDRHSYVSNLRQTSVRLPGKGMSYCAPVAATNYILWLGKNRYPRLIPPSIDDNTAGLEIANTLGEYMGTGEKTGTNTANFIRGLAKYITERGYNFTVLKYQGISDYGENYTGTLIPGMDFLASGLQGISVAWCTILFCKYDEYTNIYVPLWGHMVTLTGVTRDSNGNISAIDLHDPGGSDRPTEAFGLDQNNVSKNISIKQAESGKLYIGYGSYKELKGYPVLEDEYIRNIPGIKAVMTGVIVLSMEDPNKYRTPMQVFSRMVVIAFGVCLLFQLMAVFRLVKEEDPGISGHAYHFSELCRRFSVGGVMGAGLFYLWLILA